MLAYKAKRNHLRALCALRGYKNTSFQEKEILLGSQHKKKMITTRNPCNPCNLWLLKKMLSS